MDPDISPLGPLGPLGPRERRRRRRGRGRGRSTELEDTQELPVVGGGRRAGAGNGAATGSGDGVGAEGGAGAYGRSTTGGGAYGARAYGLGTTGGGSSDGGGSGSGSSDGGGSGSGSSAGGGSDIGLPGIGLPGILVPGGGASRGGTPRSRAAGGRAHRVGAYGSRAYRAGRRAAAARNSASAAGATAAAAQAAYDALYQRCAADVTRHTYLLTGDHALTREAVEHAFHLAWERWPEVASDPDPPGWVRAAAFEYVQAPWEWLRARRRRRRWASGGRGTKKDAHGDEPYGTAVDRRLFAALLALPESYRSAVVVYDVVGLDLPEAAAELEATTLAAAGRLTHAHEALAAAVPELGQVPPDERAEALRTRLRRFAAAQPIRTLPPGAARHRSERRTDRQLRGYALLAAALLLAAAAVTALGEDHTRDKATPPAHLWQAARTAQHPAPGVGTPPVPGHVAPAAPSTGNPPASDHVPPSAPSTGTPPASDHIPPATPGTGTPPASDHAAPAAPGRGTPPVPDHVAPAAPSTGNPPVRVHRPPA